MNRPSLEVADIFRKYGPDYLAEWSDSLSAGQRRVLGDVACCRTAELGGHLERCDHCGHQKVSYNSCRNRHCPKCQASVRADWLDRQAADLLPAPYFHVVFTLPDALGVLALQNKRAVYGILFHAAAETLLEIAGDRKHLGAEIGILAVLHTWGQNLLHHPHLHCIVTGGGLSGDGFHWVPCRDKFFLPVRVLSRVFRGKFLDLLHKAFHQGTLSFHGDLDECRSAERFNRLLDASVKTDWIVYAKPPFGGPQQVLKYLARYTHRVAISNHRLIDAAEGKVQFYWKDYADGSAQKIMTLRAGEFIRRFLLHVLPSGFMKIRHYGLLCNRFRREKLAIARRLLGVEQEPPPAHAETPVVRNGDPADATKTCPACGQGKMQIIERLLKTSPTVLSRDDRTNYLPRGPATTHDTS